MAADLLKCLHHYSWSLLRKQDLCLLEQPVKVTKDVQGSQQRNEKDEEREERENTW